MSISRLKVENMKLSPKGESLVEMYTQMANEGYETVDENRIDRVFSDFELRPFRKEVKRIFDRNHVRDVLDYGAGGSNWFAASFDDESGMSAKNYFNLESVKIYEPSLRRDERSKADAVVCFDVLEHIFIFDMPTVVRDLFFHAKKILLVNVACYPARALLPNGENAHVTVRHPLWWKGIFDGIAPEYPHVRVHLLASTAHGEVKPFRDWSADDWTTAPTYVQDR